MPGPWHLPLPGIPEGANVTRVWVDGKLVYDGTCKIDFTPIGKAFVDDLTAVEAIRERANSDPASLARYGPTREHPGDPGPRPDERPWVGKAKRKP